MKSEERLPITEEVEEVRAHGEDRMVALIVPALDNLADLVARKVTELRSALTRRRAR